MNMGQYDESSMHVPKGYLDDDTAEREDSGHDDSDQLATSLLEDRLSSQYRGVC